MNKLASVLAVVGWVCAGAVAPCVAAPITFDFTGSVTTAMFVPNDPFGGAIGAGTPFSGSYTFESTAADGNPFPANGSYSMMGVPYLFTVTFGAGTFTFATSDILSINVADGPVDGYSVLACAGGPFCFGSAAQLFLQDDQGTALTGDGLPLSAPPLSAFEVATLTFTGFVNDGFAQINGQLETLACSAGCEPVNEPISEPATLLLVGSALTALRLRGWGRRRTPPTP
jgi:hypothetical protein